MGMISSSSSFSGSSSSVTVVVPKIYAYHGKLARCSLPFLQFFCGVWTTRCHSPVLGSKIKVGC
jgi:hypothetical protein